MEEVNQLREIDVHLREKSGDIPLQESQNSTTSLGENAGQSNTKQGNKLWNWPDMGSEHPIVFYLKKWRGNPKAINKTKRKSFIASASSVIATVIGIGLVGILHYGVVSDDNLTLIIGSFGATAVLLYGELSSPLAQPRNVLVGNVMSAFIGVCIKNALPEHEWIASALAVSISIVMMQLTRTTHPPGGATALIAVLSETQRWYGFFYVIMPVTTGTLIMLIVALVFNNIARQYPQYWW